MIEYIETDPLQSGEQRKSDDKEEESKIAAEEEAKRKEEEEVVERRRRWEADRLADLERVRKQQQREEEAQKPRQQRAAEKAAEKAGLQRKLFFGGRSMAHHHQITPITFDSPSSESFSLGMFNVQLELACLVIERANSFFRFESHSHKARSETSTK